jgi:hypothetical protein
MSRDELIRKYLAVTAHLGHGDDAKADATKSKSKFAWTKDWQEAIQREKEREKEKNKKKTNSEHKVNESSFESSLPTNGEKEKETVQKSARTQAADQRRAGN